MAEKVVLSRINNLGLYTSIPDEQFGFRSQHDTSLLVAKVLHDAINKHNQQQSTILLALDIRQAFDSVWLHGLIYKLLTIHNYPLYLVSLLHTYITGRTFRVRVEASLSAPMRTSAGVPQGTVLSPILFNLYTADIPRYPSSKLAMFADDVLVYASSFYANAASYHIRNHLHTLLPWYNKWKLAINETKCEAILLKRKFTNITVHQPIIINGTQVRLAKKLKYLGVVLDTHLRFMSHIGFVLQKSFLAMQDLYVLLSHQSHMSPQNKLTLYNQIIRPVLVYAAPVWCSVSNAQMARLQRFQNRLLRCVTSAPRYVPIVELHQMTNSIRFQEYIFNICNEFYKTKPSSSVLTQNLTAVRVNHNVTHKPLYSRLPIYFEETN